MLYSTSQDGSDDGDYPANIYRLAGVEFYCAISGSIAICLPILIDVALDFIFNAASSKYQSYIPRRELFLAVILPDLFIMFYILPYKEFDW